MNRFLVAALFCAVAHAAPASQQHAPTPHVGEVSADSRVIKTAAAGSLGLHGEAARDNRAPAAVTPSKRESPSQPGTDHLVFAGLLLMLGIAIRRYGMDRK